MRTKLLSAVAISSLALGFAAASAQTTMEKGAAGAPGGAMEKSAPAGEERSPSMPQHGSSTTEKSKAAPAGQHAQGSDMAKPQNRAAEGKSDSKMDNKAAQGAGQPAGSNRMSSDTGKTAPDNKAADRAAPNAGKTVGAAPAGQARLTTEQRAQIRQQVVETGPRVTSVNFALNVGTVVPRDVRVVEVPTVIVDIHPEWRGYRYFVVNDQVVIVEPDTLRIIAVLDV
ncbi:MAG: DUF1236 domain-containing protein [Xanthobacteraceae bacterium]|nr:DUF1236 domain-containing protein [Xanthobacteraceae bacterium]